MKANLPCSIIAFLSHRQQCETGVDCLWYVPKRVDRIEIICTRLHLDWGLFEGKSPATGRISLICRIEKKKCMIFRFSCYESMMFDVFINKQSGLEKRNTNFQSRFFRRGRAKVVLAYHDTNVRALFPVSS